MDFSYGFSYDRSHSCRPQFVYKYQRQHDLQSSPHRTSSIHMSRIVCGARHLFVVNGFYAQDVHWHFLGISRPMHKCVLAHFSSFLTFSLYKYKVTQAICLFSTFNYVKSNDFLLCKLGSMKHRSRVSCVDLVRVFMDSVQMNKMVLGESQKLECNVSSPSSWCHNYCNVAENTQARVFFHLLSNRLLVHERNDL